MALSSVRKGEEGVNIIDAAKHMPQGISIITEWLGDGGQVADAEEAQARADICTGRLSGKACDQNDLSFSVTKPVALAVKRYLEVKNKIRLRVAGERRLGVCRVCTCNLRLLVHEPIDQVRAEMTDEERERLPSFCWKLI